LGILLEPKRLQLYELIGALLSTPFGDSLSGAV